MDIIDIQQVTKRYENHLALDRVTFGIPEGSVFGLLGPNGAGKTSLIRIFTKITAPDSGSVKYKGHPLSDIHLLDMGYLPEERGLYKKMEVGEQALYLARLKGLSRTDAIKRLKHWFEKFEIQSWWNKKIEELSKGMAQKVQFITTVVHDPSFIILDEPFTGFDPINAELIKNELIALRAKGVAIVLSTHRMESVEELCSHIALINRSKVILQGSVRQVREMHRTNTYEITFSGNPSSLKEVVGRVGTVRSQDQDEFHPRMVVGLHAGFTTNDLLQAVLPAATIHGLREVVPSMSEIFIQKVSESPINETSPS
ncbi:MAG: ABC transporter ATP-binding protein [Bacteroidota bacterium]